MSYSTHRSGCIGEIDLEAPHGSDDGDDGLDGVAVNHNPVLATLLLCVAILMDDSECRKRRLSCISYWCLWSTSNLDNISKAPN